MKENESQNDESAAKENDPKKEEVQARARGLEATPSTTVPRDEEPNTTVPRDDA